MPNKGNIVSTYVGKKMIKVKVTGFYRSPTYFVRRLEKTSKGAKHPRMLRMANELYPCHEDWDELTANVFADWLEEKGEAKAAMLLRQYFPFADGKPITSYNKK